MAASRGSLFQRGHPLDAAGAHRHSSLQLFVQHSDPSGGSSAGGGDRRRSQGGGLLGRLARLTHHGRPSRGQGSLSGSAGGSSGRPSAASTAASDAAQALAELSAQLGGAERGGGASSRAGGPRFLSSSGNKVVPLDAA